MDNFVKKTLKKLNFNPNTKKQYAPHKWTAPIYGYNRQFTPSNDTSTPLDKKELNEFNKLSDRFYTMHV